MCDPEPDKRADRSYRGYTLMARAYALPKADRLGMA